MLTLHSGLRGSRCTFILIKQNILLFERSEKNFLTTYKTLPSKPISESLDVRF